MEAFFYFLPFIGVAFLRIMYGDVANWGFLAIMAGFICLAIWITQRAMKHSLCSATEYLGGWITAVRHYDEWDEWIKNIVTETRHDSKGKPYRVQIDKSYRKYHPQYWVYFNTFGEEVTISQSYYDDLSTLFGTLQQLVPMNRHYYHINGDAQQYNYNGEENRCRILTKASSYQNPLRCTNNIYQFEKITQKQAFESGLYDYPPIEKDDQTPILGAQEIECADERHLRFVNAVFGKQYEFRNYLLFFKGKGPEIAEQQKAYWQSGNKNEFIVCLGISDNSKVEWCSAFSWMDSPELAVKLRGWFTKNDVFHLNDYTQWLSENVPLYWSRKKFSDFKYIKVNLKLWQQLLLLFLTLATIGVFWYAIHNQVFI